MPEISEFLGYTVGDIITLSDFQTQKEYGKMSVDFTIIETRKYSHPEDVYTYTGYIASYQATPDDEEQRIMLLIRKVGTKFDLQVYYLDNDGPSENFGDIFVEEEDDLEERFNSDLFFDDLEKPLEVTWDRQGPTNFGIEVISSESEEPDCKTIAEYFTNDDTRGNPNCFIEWTGDKIHGYIEIWYGCDIRIEDLEIFHTKQD